MMSPKPAKKKKMGRPPKPKGTRVADQLHLGFRFTSEQAAQLRMVLEHKRKAMPREFAEQATVFAMVRAWILDRLAEETSR
jgi:hypothetical protein